MLSFDQEQNHFLNIAVARQAQKHVLDQQSPDPDPATALHTDAIRALSRRRACAKALLLTAGPESAPLDTLDFRHNPRLPSLIDGFISQNTCHAARRAGAPDADAAMIAELSLVRLCIAPDVAQELGELDRLPRLFRHPRNLRRMLQQHRQQTNDHYQAILAAARHSEEAVIVAYQPLIARIAGQERRFGDMQLDDREQEARIGIIKAMGKFDHRRQNRFSSLATHYISATISRASLKQGYAIYEPEANHQLRNRARNANPQAPANNPAPVTVSLEANLADPDRMPANGLLTSLVDTSPESDPVLQSERKDLKRQVQNIMDAVLDDRERAILSMRFGIDYPRPYSRYEVARKLRVRDKVVHRIETEALRRFTEAARVELNDYI